MNNDERMYSKTEIREKRRKLERTLALQQRQLDALAKMDEAADELDQVERELADLADGEDSQAGQSAPDPDLPSDDPGTTGSRSEAILKSRPRVWLSVRDVLTESTERGWTSGDDHARMSYRASLRRLAHNNDHIERDESGITHLYRWMPDQDDDQQPLSLAPVMHANGSGHWQQSAYQGGQSDE